MSAACPSARPSGQRPRPPGISCRMSTLASTSAAEHSGARIWRRSSPGKKLTFLDGEPTVGGPVQRDPRDGQRVPVRALLDQAIKLEQLLDVVFNLKQPASGPVHQGDVPTRWQVARQSAFLI